MTPIGLTHYLVVGALLFVLGFVGFLTRRNLILMVLSVELMLHGVAVNLTAFARHHGHHDGQAFTVFLLTVAACDAGLALSLILGAYRMRRTLDVQAWSRLGEGPRPTLAAEEPLDETEETGAGEPPPPRLTPAGRLPGPKASAKREVAARD